METLFDLFLYLANWGTRQFQIRIPERLLNVDLVKSYCVSDHAAMRKVNGHVILNYSRDESDGENDGNDDGQGWMARSFLKFQPGLGTRYLSQDAQDLLLTYHWSGNIRELRNTVLAAAVDASRCIEARHLRPHLTEPDTKSMAKHVKLLDNLLLDALAEVGQITLAQLHDRLSIPKSTLHRHLQQMVEKGRVHRLADGGWVRFISGTAGEKTAAFLPDRQSHALRLAREAGRVTRQQFAEAVGIFLRTASRELATMVDLGLLIPDGRGGKMGGYVYQQTGTL